jgi:hypothetical protein
VRRPDWDLIPYALVALVLVVSTGFGIYVAGPWRLRVVALLVLARRWLHWPTGQASRGGDVLASVVILSIAAAYYGAILELIPRPHVDPWDHMNRAGDAWLAGIAATPADRSSDV